MRTATAHISWILYWFNAGCIGTPLEFWDDKESIVSSVKQIRAKTWFFMLLNLSLAWTYEKYQRVISLTHYCFVGLCVPSFAYIICLLIFKSTSWGPIFYVIFFTSYLLRYLRRYFIYYFVQDVLTPCGRA